MTADELEVAVARAARPARTPQVNGIAALLDGAEPAARDAAAARPALRRRAAVVVGPGVRTGVPLLVDNPREVGADRVVNTLAAHQLCGTACVVVDFGTSTNIDVGLEPRASTSAARSRPASRSPWRRWRPARPRCAPSSWCAPRSVIGKNTVECLQSGVLYGFAGQVDGLVRRILAELGAGPVTVLGTGGLAPLMAEESETITTTSRT